DLSERADLLEVGADAERKDRLELIVEAFFVECDADFADEGGRSYSVDFSHGRGAPWRLRLAAGVLPFLAGKTAVFSVVPRALPVIPLALPAGVETLTADAWSQAAGVGVKSNSDGILRTIRTSPSKWKVFGAPFSPGTKSPFANLSTSIGRARMCTSHGAGVRVTAVPAGPPATWMSTDSAPSSMRRCARTRGVAVVRAKTWSPSSSHSGRNESAASGASRKRMPQRVSSTRSGLSARPASSSS